MRKYSLDIYDPHCDACEFSYSKHSAGMSCCPGRGQSSRNVRLLVIVESPGVEELKARQPVTGVERKLLYKLLDDNHLRQCTYVTNGVKCPVGEPPSRYAVYENHLRQAQIRKCRRSYLLKEIELLDPRVIICMGRIASKAFHKRCVMQKPIQLSRMYKDKSYRNRIAIHTHSLRFSTLHQEPFVLQLHTAFRIAKEILDDS